MLETLHVEKPAVAGDAIRILQPSVYLTATRFGSNESFAYRNNRI